LQSPFVPRKKKAKRRGGVGEEGKKNTRKKKACHGPSCTELPVPERGGGCWKRERGYTKTGNEKEDSNKLPSGRKFERRQLEKAKISQKKKKRREEKKKKNPPHQENICGVRRRVLIKASKACYSTVGGGETIRRSC